MPQQVVKKAEIEAMPGLHKQHFLNQSAQRVNKSLGDLTGISGFGFHLVDIPPGAAASEAHTHYYEDECVYVLKGQGIAMIGVEQVKIEAGDFIGYAAGGAAHTIQNTESTVLQCIVVGERKAHDVTDYPRIQKRLYRNKDLPWNLVSLSAVETPQGGSK